MAKDTLTIALNGEVSLEDFATAIDCFKRIVIGLSKDAANAPSIQWTVVGLDPGSAIATVRGTAPLQIEDEHPVEIVVDAYERIGRALQSRAPFPYSSVEQPTRKLLGLINGHISSIRFETEDFDAEVFGEGEQVIVEPSLKAVAYGSVRGRVQSLSSRGGLRFTLYDLADDRAVSCYLAPGFENTMRKAWGRIADVEGFIRRHPKTGRPTTIRQIEHVTIVPEDRPGTWREAIGCAPIVHGTEPSEVTIRKLRNAD